MASIGNVIWFILGGLILGLGWFLIGLFFFITIIGIPIGKACFEFGKLSMFPFGKEVIRETELKGSSNVSGIKKLFHIVVNIIWFPIGITLTIVYFVYGILSFITIIGIPVGVVYVRMGQFLLFPIGARIVNKKQALASAVVNEMERRQK
jgi:uncharacterized membrane protein YccF (DUF307 family)